MRVLFAAALLVLSGGAASAETPDGYIQKPEWLSKPTATDVGKAVARTQATGPVGVGVTIKVAVDCTVAADGRLENCQVASEAPAHCAGGEAALRLMSKFKMAPATADGQATAGGRVRVPIKFVGAAKPMTSPTDIARVCRYP
jgi:protein TonB